MGRRVEVVMNIYKFTNKNTSELFIDLNQIESFCSYETKSGTVTHVGLKSSHVVEVLETPEEILKILESSV
jgi:hypothetical protein